MTFVPQKAIKGQPLADFLAAHPVSETLKLHTNIPDEVIKANITLEDDVLQMFFDGASRTGPTCKIIAGVGVVFVSLKKSCSSSCIFTDGILLQQCG